MKIAFLAEPTPKDYYIFLLSGTCSQGQVDGDFYRLQELLASPASYMTYSLTSCYISGPIIITFLHSPLKFKIVSVAKVLRDLSPKLLNYLAGKGLQLSFTLNCVVKRANDLKTISTWLLLLSTCFRNLKPFFMDRNHSRTRQTHNRDIINI